MLARLFGCAAPYGIATRNPIIPNGVGLERIEPGAFDQQCLDDAVLTHVNVNHSKPGIPDASVRLLNYHSGLYFSISLPNNAESRALMRQRSEWQGVSIGWLIPDAVTQMHWPTSTNLVLRIGFVTNVAIIVGSDRKPAYPSTWIDEFSDAAVNR